MPVFLEVLQEAVADRLAQKGFNLSLYFIAIDVLNRADPNTFYFPSFAN